MVYITSTGRRLPDKIRFNPDEMRRVLPKRLFMRGYSKDEIKRAMTALEDIIKDAKPEGTGTSGKK